ncbi:hypothetical protein FRB96_009270 [Tulasnella sp. 330]|nr:hypothetical protein FRB96_009270 [Tulasnella sp. 330]
MNVRSSPAPRPVPSPQPPHTYPSTPQQQHPPSSIINIHGVVETHHAVKHTHDRSGKKMMNQYIVMETLGKGMHGTVRRGIDSLTGELVAIKIVERVPKHKRLGMQAPRRPHARAGLTGAVSTNAAMRTTEDKIRREIAIMKKCHHPNVVQLKEVIDDPHNKRIFLILEYMQGGEVKWRTGPPDDLPLLTVEQIRNIFRQVILGLEYLHYQGIIHRDIKPANLLLKSDGTVKISDFGVSHFSYALRLASATTSTESPSLPSRTIRTSSPSPRRTPVRNGEGDDFGRFGPGGGTDVEDILMDESDLAKTAGSPAFFAPELCHQGDLSGLAASFGLQMTTSKPGMFGGGGGEQKTLATSTLPSVTPSSMPLPAPSSTLSTETQPHRSLSGSSRHTYKATAAGEGPSTIRAPSSASSSSRPLPTRQQSSASQRQTSTQPTSSSALSTATKEPPPITAAIDVWALGVTLYCLLFGRPPFNAPTEFMLYKIIPTEDFEVPERMGREGRRTGGRDRRKRRRRETMKPTRRTGAASESDESDGRRSLVGSRNKQEGYNEGVLEDEDGDDEEDLDEGFEVIELLERLLEKDPNKRISLHDLKRMPWVLRGLSNPSQWLTENDPRREEMVVIQDSDVNDAALFKRARFKRVITKIKEKTKGALGGLLSGLGLGIGRSRSKSTGSVNDQGGEQKRDQSRKRSGRGEEEQTPTMPSLSNFPGPGSGTVSAPPGRTSTPAGAKRGHRASMPLSILQTSGSGGYSSPSSPSASQPRRSPVGLWSRFGQSSSAGGTPKGNEFRESSSLRTPRSGSPVAGNNLVIGGDDEEDGSYFPRRAGGGGEHTDGGNTTSATDVPTRTPRARRASATVLLAPPSGNVFRRSSSMSGSAESPTGTSGGRVPFGKLSSPPGSGSMMGRPKPSMESVDTAVTSSTTSASAASASGSVDLGRSKMMGRSAQKGRDTVRGDQSPATPKGGWLGRWGSSRRRKGVVGNAAQPLTPLIPPETQKSPTSLGEGKHRPPATRRSVSALESVSDRGSSSLSILAASSASALRYRPSTEVFTDDSSIGAMSTASLSPVAYYGGVSAGVRSVRSRGGYHDTDNDEMDSVRSGTRISFSFSDDSDEEDGADGGVVGEPNATTMLGSGGFPIRNRGLGWEPLYPQQPPSRPPQHSLSGGGGYGTSPTAAGPSSSTASSPGSHSPLGLGSSHHHHGGSSPSMAYSYSSPSSHSQSQMHHSNSMHSQLQLQHPYPVRQRSSNLSLELLPFGSSGGAGSFHATTSSPSPLATQSFPATGSIAGGGSRTSFSEGYHDNIEEEGDDAEDEEEEEFLEVKRKGEPGARARSMESERVISAKSRT